MSRMRFSSHTIPLAQAGLAMLLAGGMLAGTATAALCPKEDRGVYPASPLALTVTAGGTFIDPDFGTTIMRVTDASDSADNHIAYSYWPTFNKDDTYFHINRGGAAYLYHFDPTHMKILGKEPLFSKKTPYGTYPGWEDSTWSATDPNVLLAHEGPRLWGWNVVTKTYSLIKDFGAELPAGIGIAQMSRSLDDNVFGFTQKRYSAPWDVVGYGAWKRDTNELKLNTTTTQLDEVQVDKSGRYLVIKTGLQGAGAIEVKIADLQTGGIQNLTDNGPDYAPGHSDNGYGMVVGADNWRDVVTGRQLATPHTQYTVLNYNSDWSQEYHISMLADGDQWAVLSLTLSSTTLHSSGVFKNEIIMVATDGSQRVIRLAHHRTDYVDTRNYWDLPMANISRDGRFIAYTSNWDNSGRRDVFILRVPIFGDADMNGLVDMADYVLWFNNYGRSGGVGWDKGDWNADGQVDMADYVLWFNNYGQDIYGTGAAVPEPAVAAMLAAALGMRMIRRRK
ncbi:MAG: hypothetical protein ACE15C_10790 [Phycisphaerae bacterium]